MKAAQAWLVGALVLVTIAIGAFVTLRANRKPAIKYETVKVDQGRIVARVTATGTLSALVTVQVGSQVSGRISQILVDFNSVVKKGDVIAAWSLCAFANPASPMLSPRLSKTFAPACSAVPTVPRGGGDKNFMNLVNLDTLSSIAVRPPEQPPPLRSVPAGTSTGAGGAPSSQPRGNGNPIGRRLGRERRDRSAFVAMLGRGGRCGTALPGC